MAFLTFAFFFLEILRFSRILPPTPENLPVFLNAFSFSDLDETCYIDSFWDVICDVCIFSVEISPAPELSPSPLTFSSGFEHFSIVRFG